MPARSGPGVVVTDEIRFEDEVVVDTMSQVRLVHLAASVGFRGDDVVLCLRKVKPVFRSLVELEADLRTAVVLRNAIAQAGVEHVAFAVGWVLKWIAHHAPERSGLTVWTHAYPVAAHVQVELSQSFLNVHPIQVDGSEIGRGCETHNYWSQHWITSQRVVRQHNATVEPVGDVPCAGDCGLNEGLVRGVQVEVTAEEVHVLQPVGGRLQQLPVAESAFIALAIADTEG